MPLSTGYPRHALRQRDAQPAADGFDQLVGSDRVVGVAEPPILLGIAEVFGGEIIEPVVLNDRVLLHDHEAVRLRHETPPDIGNRDARGGFQGRNVDAMVAAVGRKQAGLQPDLLHQRLQGCVRIGHGMPPRPSALSALGGLRPASRSFCCRWLKNRLPPFWSKPRSSTLSTRKPRLTLARIGLSATSNASSVMLSSVMRTGTTRLWLQTNRLSGASIGTISSVPDCARLLFDNSCALVG